jgi:putative NADH-flavin reductase
MLMNITILGATGRTGRELVDQALAAGHHVTALTRDEAALAHRERLTIVSGDTSDARALDCALAGNEVVLSALGGRPWRRRERVCSSAMRHAIPSMSKHGIRRIIAISTFGAGDTRPHLGWISRHVLFGCVLRSEVADKEAMEAQLAASELNWTIVRVGLLIDEAPRGHWRSADDGSIKHIGEIARADVAAFMLGALDDETWVRRTPTLMY